MESCLRSRTLGPRFAMAQLHLRMLTKEQVRLIAKLSTTLPLDLEP